MQLEADVLHTVSTCELDGFGPERNQLRLPLPAQDLGKVLRPRFMHPVRLGIGFRARRTPGKAYDAVYFETLRQSQGVAQGVGVHLPDGWARVQRIPVAGECADREPPIGDHLSQTPQLTVVGEKPGRIAVRVSGERAGAEFHGFEL